MTITRFLLPKQILLGIAAVFVLSILTVIFSPHWARAAQFTVCAAGCDYTTITAAHNAGATSDIYYIGATYDPSGETYPISLNRTGEIVDCQNSGAIIGNAGGGQTQIYIPTNGSLQNCNARNIRIILQNYGITVANNTFSTASAVSFFLSTATSFNITNNTGINDVYINGTSGSGTFSNNTFDLNWAGWSPNVPILFGTAMTSTVFSDNTFHSNLAGFTTFATAFGSGLTFSGNTFDFSVNPTGVGVQHTILDISGQNNTVTNNKLSFPTADAGTRFLGVRIFPANAGTATDVTVNNNTIKIPVGLNGSSSGPVGIWAGSNGAFSTTVTSSYNIIASTSTNANSVGILLDKNAATTVTLVNDYNDFFRINTNLSLVGGAVGSLGANTRTSDPFFRIKDASSANDFLLAPFSNFLNVNGTYIGADSGPRRTTIYVDPLGTINYSSVDTTSTQEALDNLFSGDTIHLAAGTYSGITIASTSVANSDITLTGVGAATIINGGVGSNAITMLGLNNCTVSNLLVQNAGASNAGIKFATSTNCTAANVTSTNNGYNIWFATSSVNNSVNDSTLLFSAGLDVLSGSDSDNSVRNTSFGLASTTINGIGNINLYFKTRALVLNSLAAPVAGAQASFTDGNGSATSTVTTALDGYTAFTGYVRASTLTNSIITYTNGGFNPYVITAAATSTYAASTTQQIISSPNQTVSITVFASSLPPTAPSSPTVSSVSTSSVLLGWTDTASGPSQENNFITDYILSSGTFPGTTSTAAQDAVSKSITGLNPNTSYTLRVAAVNTIATSAYVTTSPLYTLAIVPGTPTVQTNGQTGALVTIDDGGNPTTTEFALFATAQNKFIGADGNANNAVPVWRIKSAWGSNFAITGLQCGTTYGIAVEARNGDTVVTSLSNTASVSTAACAASSNDGHNSGSSPGAATPSNSISPAPTSPEPAAIDPIVTKPEIPETVSEKNELKNNISVEKPEPAQTITSEPPHSSGNSQQDHATSDGNNTVEKTNNTQSSTTQVQGYTATGFGLLGARSIESLRVFGNAVRQFVQSPSVQQTASRRVVPVVVGITTVSVLSFITWADILPLLRYLFLQPLLLLGKKRRLGWGQIYNSLNKLPVDLATVRLIDVLSGRTVQTRVSDIQGRYSFIAQPGTYRLEVTKNALMFPSQLLSGFTTDGRRADIYHGETIAVTEKDAVIAANIPLDPSGENNRPTRLLLQRLGRSTQIIFSVLSLLITAGSALIAPRWYVIGLLGLHALLLVIFQHLALPAKIKSWGVVYDETTKNPIMRTVVRLFNQQFNKLVETQITDARGRYYFLAGDNNYYVTYDHPAYTSQRSTTINLSGKDAGTITFDVGLKSRSDSGSTPFGQFTNSMHHPHPQSPH